MVVVSLVELELWWLIVILTGRDVVVLDVMIVMALIHRGSHRTNFQISCRSKQSARELRQKIRANRTFPAAYYGPFFAQPSDRGTAHLSVLGPDGELVALTRYSSTYVSLVFTQALALQRLEQRVPSTAPISSLPAFTCV